MHARKRNGPRTVPCGTPESASACVTPESASAYQIYPSELQLNKANISDTEAPFLDLHLSVANGFVSSKIYDSLS